jgi:hypothetical protein
MTTGQLNQSAFALGFRTIDCSLDGGLDRVSVLLALRFAPLGLCFADTLPSGLVHFLGKILVATGINLFREEILTMQFGLEISQHLPRGLIGCLGFNAAESIIPQSRHAIPLMAKYRCGIDIEDSCQGHAAKAEPDPALLERVSADRVDNVGSRFLGLAPHRIPQVLANRICNLHAIKTCSLQLQKTAEPAELSMTAGGSSPWSRASPTKPASRR